MNTQTLRYMVSMLQSPAKITPHNHKDSLSSYSDEYWQLAIKTAFDNLNWLEYNLRANVVWESFKYRHFRPSLLLDLMRDDWKNDTPESECVPALIYPPRKICIFYHAGIYGDCPAWYAHNWGSAKESLKFPTLVHVLAYMRDICDEDNVNYAVWQPETEQELRHYESEPQGSLYLKG